MMFQRDENKNAIIKGKLRKCLKFNQNQSIAEIFSYSFENCKNNKLSIFPLDCRYRSCIH